MEAIHRSFYTVPIAAWCVTTVAIWAMCLIVIGLPMLGHRACWRRANAATPASFLTARPWDCQEFRARGRYRHQMTNRSPKITANWVFASAHSRGGRFHSWAAVLSTRYSSFIAASSPGK